MRSGRLITLARVSSDRTRLLVGSLLVALIVGVVGGFVWSQVTSGDDDDLDASLTEPGLAAEPPDSLQPIPEMTGDALAEATVFDAAGEPISTASFVGQPSVINFWFSTCIPCARELADFAEIDAEFDDADVRFIGINPQDSVPVMERFAGERGVTYDLFRDPDIEFQLGLDITFFPYTLFVASDGTIVDQTGVLDADGLREKVDELLRADQEIQA